MPFSQPPVPSVFDVGNINAGHAHFDTTGVTFFAPDGVTQLFRFDFTTGVLTFSSQGSGQRIAMTATELDFYTGGAFNQKGFIEALLVAPGAANERGELFVESPAEPGRNVASMTLIGEAADGTNQSEWAVSAQAILIQCIAGGGPARLAGGLVDDTTSDFYLRGRNGLEWISGGVVNHVTDANSDITAIPHHLPFAPSGVVLTMSQSSNLTARAPTGAFTATTFDIQDVRNVTTGALVGNGQSVICNWMAFL